MTPEQSAMVEFLRQRLVDDIEQERASGNMLITHGAPALGIPREKAEERAHRQLHAAEVRLQFFEETVVPYLDTAGPTGRIADRQLHLLASEHHGNPHCP